MPTVSHQANRNPDTGPDSTKEGSGATGRYQIVAIRWTVISHKVIDYKRGLIITITLGELTQEESVVYRRILKWLFACVLRISRSENFMRINRASAPLKMTSMPNSQ